MKIHRRILITRWCSWGTAWALGASLSFTACSGDSGGYYGMESADEGRNQGGPNQPKSPGPGNSSGATDGDHSTPEPESAQTQWIQLSPDDSTSMASAQMFKTDYAWGRALKRHEFINYYDPPAGLADAEPWAASETVAPGIELGLTAEQITASAIVPCTPSATESDSEPEATCPTEPEIAQYDAVEMLFHMRAAPHPRAERRSWNLFVCVDVSGSMTGEKIEFVRESLLMMLDHTKAGDRISLVTFESNEHTIFTDLEADSEAATIRAAFSGLAAGGSTNMIGGLNRTYELAQHLYDPEAINRVLLFSDGAANVGDTDIQTFASLTRINGQEGIYLSGVGVGLGFDWNRMDALTDAGKGAFVFLPNRNEVSLLFGDYFPKLVNVAADQIEIEMSLPLGLRLDSFSGEEVSVDPEERLQNVVLAAGDDMTFLARFVIEDEEAMDQPVTLTATVRPLDTGELTTVELSFETVRDLLSTPGLLFERTRLVDAFARYATGDALAPEIVDINAALDGYGSLDWGLSEIDALLAP